ncbi:MAG: sulfotransferase [Fimbriimonadia bacterium]|nr:sulfotransferase [Fimbriimonadia bacterium]
MGAIKVLYIAGCGRSGSTILHNAVSQLDNCFGGGEIHSLLEPRWRPLYERLCGCGATLSACDFWSRALEKMGLKPEDAEPLFALKKEAMPPIQHRAFARDREQYIQRIHQHNPALVERVRAIYETMSHLTDHAIIVDESKSPMYGQLLRSIPEIELNVVHLVRDPRGFAYSHLKRNPDRQDRKEQEVSLMGAVRRWMGTNLSTETFAKDAPERYMLARYEDFVSSPRGTLSSIARFVGVSENHLPLLDDQTIQVKPTHTLGGSAVRYETESIKVKLDEAWRAKLSPAQKLVVNTLTASFRKRYGYG